MFYDNQEPKNEDSLVLNLISLLLIVLVGVWLYQQKLPWKSLKKTAPDSPSGSAAIGESGGCSTAGGIKSSPSANGEVYSPEKLVLPIKWGRLGNQLTATGVIDTKKFKTLYRVGGGQMQTAEKLLSKDYADNLVITPENSGVFLNAFWALGLGNQNHILEEGPMNDPRFGGPGNFASTGGWTLARGDAMSHYSRHGFITLTPEQQKMVERISQNIYRPCCDNPTYFPDCNHGMAMLGFLELMASQGADEKSIYQAALKLNSYWFPQNYEVINSFLKSRNTTPSSLEPQEILGMSFSSASGFARIQAAVSPPPSGQKGTGCEIN